MRALDLQPRGLPLDRLPANRVSAMALDPRIDDFSASPADWPIGEQVTVGHWFMPKRNRKAKIVTYGWLTLDLSGDRSVLLRELVIRFPKPVLIPRVVWRCDMALSCPGEMDRLLKFCARTEVSVLPWELET